MQNHDGETQEPKILIPFVPAGEDSRDHQDFFIILRPETNGTLVESLLMKVITGHPEYKAAVRFVYLANIPGDFIVRRRIVEQHYHLKISFAHRGAELFTPGMSRAFTGKFGAAPGECRILGSFRALEALGMDEEELFRERVATSLVLEVNGQNIKKIRDLFVVNYDIPALLHKNSRNTDVAVMVFRSALPEGKFREMLSRMGEALVAAGILGEHFPLSRVFHYSKGPFEFFLDAQGYLLEPGGTPFPAGELDFVRYLNARGIPLRVLEGLLRHPMACFGTSGGGLVEGDIFQYTFGNTFEEAYQNLMCIRSQFYVR